MDKNAAQLVKQKDDVFGRIAKRYDFLCDLFSIGLHRLWKQRVARIISQKKWDNLLDVASGTGDIVLRVSKYVDIANKDIVASDLSPEMLEMAKKRLPDSINYQILDAESLVSIPNCSIDCYSMSLGLKICDRQAALKEAYRVLKPGGSLVVLEASNIRYQWLHRFYLIYMSLCMPCIGWLATGGDASAYRYLLQGVRDFPSAEQLAEEIKEIGFSHVAFERLSLGIVAIHTAHKS